MDYRLFARHILQCSPRAYLTYQNGSRTVPPRIVALLDYWDANPDQAPCRPVPRVTISNPPVFKERRKR